jgi:hypothetical protein
MPRKVGTRNNKRDHAGKTDEAHQSTRKGNNDEIFSH